MHQQIKSPRLYYLSKPSKSIDSINLTRLRNLRNPKMSKTDAFNAPKIEFPVLNAQESNYASWLESFQSTTHAKSHEHY